MGDQFLGRQRGQVSGLGRDDGVQKPFLLGQQLGRVFVLVVQRGVESIEFFVKSFKVFIVISFSMKMA